MHVDIGCATDGPCSIGEIDIGCGTGELCGTWMLPAQTHKIGCVDLLVMIAILDAFFEDPGSLKVPCLSILFSSEKCILLIGPAYKEKYQLPESLTEALKHGRESTQERGRNNSEWRDGSGGPRNMTPQWTLLDITGQEGTRERAKEGK